ncbi:MAG TPA: SUF system Fe-S cluster assembly protein [Methylophilaceae bacterium]|jgi:FeS assembly SUF system protein|nr:SUF system Fe-S cluster assembly protein [Methylophilaceae bacterium]
MLDWKTLMDQQENPAAGDELKARVIDVLRSIYDPEIPVNIYDLGLIYGLEISPQGEVHVRMTLTAPNCPVAQTFPATVKEALLCVGGVSDANVELVWDPPWSRDNMSEAARLQLGML